MEEKSNQQTIKTHEGRIEEINDKLQDAISLILLMENDFSMQTSDEVYTRSIKMVHRLIKSAQEDLSNIKF